MQLLLIPIKNPNHIRLKIIQKQILHLIRNLIQKPPNILMPIIVVQQPSQSLIDPYHIIVQVIDPPSIVILQLLHEG